MEYRILKENEIKEAIELVARVAKKDIYKDFDQEGINSFNQVNCDTFYRNKQNLTYICLENKKIIGIITLTQGKHLSLLFVDKQYQRKGIGKRLVEIIDNLVLGDIEVKRNGKIINKVNVTVKNDVKEANFIELYWRYLSDILGGNINV